MGVPSGAGMNWTSVSFAVNSFYYVLADVVDMQVNRNASHELHRGGASVFHTLITIPVLSRSCKVISTNVISLGQVPQGVVGILSGILNDPYNGEGLGAVVVTLFNAVLIENPYAGKQNEYGHGSLMFVAASSDGTTDPLFISPTV